ncbi:threonine--tRNA ligase [Filimonas sp.]|nr:threonine--tRNA ligase [Filimonas sp.]
MLEHYAGKFPLWISPLQVKILPISDKFMDYCKEILTQLNSKGIRAEIDDRSEKIGRKIRDTELAHIPYMFVVGEKEMNEKAVSLRIQGKGDQGSIPVSEIIADMKKSILERI